MSWLGYCIVDKETGLIVKTGNPKQAKVFKNPGIAKSVIKQSQYTIDEDELEIVAVMAVGPTKE